MASKRISRLSKILAVAVADADEIFQLDGRLERFVHFCALVVRQFIIHRCFVRASALSYATILALIPLLAVALSVTSSLLNPQQEAKLTHFVEKTVARVAPAVNITTNSTPAFTAPLPPPETNVAVANDFSDEAPGTNTSTPPPAAVAPATETNLTVNTQNEVAQTVHDLIQKTSNGTLGSVGLIFLVITAISLLRGIEETFNDMWGVTRGRTWWLQCMLYWFIISLLAPLLLTTALGLTGSGYLQHTRHFIESSHVLGPIYSHAVPIVILGFMLGVFYKLTPNTKVNFSAAMIGGVIAGAGWHGYNQLSFLLLSRALNASKYYGGLALVVLVMGGLYVLWVIVLFGAQISYAFQNRTAYLQDRLAENVNQRGREFVALRIMTCLARRFHNGLRPATVPEISLELGVPSRLTQSVLCTLTVTRLVAEVTGTEAAFVPARPLDAINAYDILIAMRTGTGQELPMCEAPELAAIYGEFARIEKAERNAAAGVTLLTLANRTSPPAVLPEPKNIEPDKPVVISGAIVQIATPQPAELPKTAPFPEKIEPPSPPPEEEPPRRETARPEENMDFPL